MISLTSVIEAVSKSRASDDKSRKEGKESCGSLEVYRTQNDDAPGLKILRQMQGSFAKAVAYCTYLLKNRSERYSSKTALEVAKVGKERRSLLKNRYQ